MSQSSPTYEPIDDSRMTLMDHLRELRTRLIWVASALVIGTLISMLFVSPLLQFIIRPLSESGAQPMAIGPTDTIGVFFRVSFASGAVLAMPVIVYHVIAFISPGLYPHEKRNLLLTLPGFMVLFLVGAAFAYFFLLPAAVGFLQNFLGDIIAQEWTIDRYIGFVTRIVFWIGVAFEMPLVIAFLARAGIVSGPQMMKYWRHSIVVVAIAAAAITPTVDPVNMTLVMVPLIVLYMSSVGLAHLLYRPRTPRDFSKDDFIPKEFQE